MFWVMFFVFLIACVFFGFIYKVVQMGIRHSENLTRIRNGYPTLDGAMPKQPETVDGDGGYTNTGNFYN
jgi:hypothetical protein